MTNKTPPEVKWLLVERATLVGDIALLEQRRTLLDAEITRVRNLVAAVDTSIRLVERGLRPDAAGRVRRHCQNYGRRGALKEFLVATLQGAGEAGLSARAVTLLASAHFELDFVSKAEFTNYLRNTVHPRLRELRQKDLVENIPGQGRDGMRWRWKRQLPTLAELALLAGPSSGSALAPGAADGHQDPA